MDNSKLKTQNSELNLILTGFMGTGKTTVGYILAQKMTRLFIDMDEEIENRAGMAIREIFVTQGENAFRQRERTLCRELAQEQSMVIATGGGTLVDAVNRDLMMKNGVVFCMTATPEILLERLKEDMSRPLLQTPDPVVRLQELLAARTEAYAAFLHHIDTTDLSPEQIAEVIYDTWRTLFP